MTSHEKVKRDFMQWALAPALGGAKVLNIELFIDFRNPYKKPYTYFFLKVITFLGHLGPG